MARLLAAALCVLALACGSKQATPPDDPGPKVTDTDDDIDEDVADDDDDGGDDDDDKPPKTPPPKEDEPKWSLAESGAPVADACAQAAGVRESDGCKGMSWADDVDTCLAHMDTVSKAVVAAMGSMDDDAKQDEWDALVDWASCLDEAGDCGDIEACTATYRDAATKPFGG